MTALDFSIVVCNYNYGRFLGDAIESCLDQDYAADRFEVIVVDDGSTDESGTVLDGYAGHPRVRLISQGNLGQAAAFCRGIEAATGSYVCFLDSDDILLPNKLSSIAARIAALAPPAEDFFLCHDIAVVDGATGSTIDHTWFDVVGLRRYGPMASIDLITEEFAFSIPCGQVMSRSLAIRIADCVPSWEWRRGADAVFAHAALIVAGTVHYFDTPLAHYRVHGGNHVAELNDGCFQYRNKSSNDAQRWPKLLHFLESVIDAVALDPKQRASRIAYVRRLERQVRRLSITRRFTEPPFAFYVFPAASHTLAISSLDGCAAQTYANADAVILRAPGDDPVVLPSRLAHIRTSLLESSEGMTSRDLARAYFQDRADYFCFLTGGDVPDPFFVERHLHFHRFSALCGVTACDIRFIDPGGVLLHAGVFRTGGIWQRLPAFLAPLTTTLAQWLFPPPAACVLRRSRLLDAFFERLMQSDIPDIDPFAPWLLLQFVQHTVGSVRINEALVNICLAPGTEASYARVVDPALMFGADFDPDIEEAVVFMFDLYCSREQVMNRLLPGQWRRRFVSWLLQQSGEHLRQRLVHVAERRNATAAQELLTTEVPATPK